MSTIIDCRCRVEASCRVYPSEDPKKIERATSNVLACHPSVMISHDNEDVHTLRAMSDNLDCLQRIRETICSGRRQGVYRRILQRNLEGSATWLYLNKQAAFVDRVAVCGEPQESPLGPIRVTITSPEIDRVVDWLIRCA